MTKLKPGFDIDEFAKEKGKYRADAYRLVGEGFEVFMSTLDKKRHITGPELVKGVFSLAISHYGYLAPEVLRSYGVTSPLDIGHIVFHLIEAELMQRSDDDKLEDFDIPIDFDSYLRQAFDDRLDAHPPRIRKNDDMDENGD